MHACLLLLTLDTGVPYTVAMDIEAIKQQLDRRRGQWTVIAEVAGLSRKTLQRIMSDPGYNPTLATITSLEDAIRGTRPKQQREPA